MTLKYRPALKRSVTFRPHMSIVTCPYLITTLDVNVLPSTSTTCNKTLHSIQLLKGCWPVIYYTIERSAFFIVSYINNVCCFCFISIANLFKVSKYILRSTWSLRKLLNTLLWWGNLLSKHKQNIFKRIYCTHKRKQMCCCCVCFVCLCARCVFSFQFNTEDWTL